MLYCYLLREQSQFLLVLIKDMLIYPFYQRIWNSFKFSEDISVTVNTDVHNCIKMSIVQ